MTQHRSGAGQWGKVARWAGIGNNREKSGSGETMAEETGVQAAEERDMTLEDSQEAQANSGQGAEETDASSGLKKELEQVKGERDQLLDRLARLQAEFENSRRREVKERQDVRDYAVQNAVEPFLGVMDNFQLALNAEGSVDQLRSGVELILRQMDDVLRGLNVQSVESVGQQFDPRVHEALGSIETAEYPDHQVIEEIRKGYKLRDKLLRPALVKIAVNGKQVSE